MHDLDDQLAVLARRWRDEAHLSDDDVLAQVGARGGAAVAVDTEAPAPRSTDLWRTIAALTAAAALLAVIVLVAGRGDPASAPTFDDVTPTVSAAPDGILGPPPSTTPTAEPETLTTTPLSWLPIPAPEPTPGAVDSRNDTWLATGPLAAGCAPCFAVADAARGGAIVAGSDGNDGTIVQRYDDTTGTWAIAAHLPRFTTVHAEAGYGGAIVLVDDDGDVASVDTSTGGFVIGDREDDLDAAAGCCIGTITVFGPDGAAFVHVATGTTTAAGDHDLGDHGPRFALPMASDEGVAEYLVMYQANGDDEILTATTYDSAARTFTDIGPTPVPAVGATAVRLFEGSTLFAGGTVDGNDTADAWVYDPLARTFTPTSPMTSPRSGAVGGEVGRGNVLIAGGTTNGAPVADSQLYDPFTRTFTTAAAGAQRTDAVGVSLGALGLLVIGGTGDDATAPFTAAIYDGGSHAHAAGFGGTTPTRRLSSRDFGTTEYGIYEAGPPAELYVDAPAHAFDGAVDAVFTFEERHPNQSGPARTVHVTMPPRCDDRCTFTVPIAELDLTGEGGLDNVTATLHVLYDRDQPPDDTAIVDLRW